MKGRECTAELSRSAQHACGAAGLPLLCVASTKRKELAGRMSITAAHLLAPQSE